MVKYLLVVKMYGQNTIFEFSSKRKRDDCIKDLKDAYGDTISYATSEAKEKR